MEKMLMRTENAAEVNLRKIMEMFPECIREKQGKNGELIKCVDFRMLKEILGDYAADGEETYEFSWVGKKAALKEAHRGIRKTLRPYPSESKSWDDTENLYIEGDNLDVLKLLQESYLGSVDVIYIDPPYNTGNDFIYKDNFRRSAEEYNARIGLFDEDRNRMFINNYSNGRFHSDWCSMIYPRLLLARDLLKPEGAIFISIDDNEVDNLKKICDEVFGEQSFVTMFSWIKTTNPPSLGSKVRDNLEYILCYEKNFSASNKLYGRESNQKDSPLANATNRVITVIIPSGSCDFPSLISGTVNRGKKDSDVELLDDVIVENAVNKNDFRVSFHSKWGQNNIDEEVAAGTRFVIKDSSYFSIRYVKGNIDYVVPDKFLHYDKFKVKDNEYGRKEVEELLGKVGFDYPKNTPLIETLIKMYMKDKKSGLVMDFFSGSATTAQALFSLNAEDNGSRKFILVQYPEICAEGSAAKEAGYDTICEIGKKRIRKAGEKIEKETGADLDYGFRVFKVDESNMRDVYFSPDEYDQSLLPLLESNIKPDRCELDLLFGCLLDWGLPLSLPYSSEIIDGVSVHTYNHGDLAACFEDNIPDSVVTAIAKRKPRRAVFRDSSFANSPAKINVEETFKLWAPDTKVKVI